MIDFVKNQNWKFFFQNAKWDIFVQYTKFNQQIISLKGSNDSCVLAKFYIQVKNAARFPYDIGWCFLL